MNKLAKCQSGMALLAAILVMSLVVTLASGALWSQWQHTEGERSERSRQQTKWLLEGVQDWALMMLREDSRTGGDVDHLAEAWAAPLQEANLTSFLSSDRSPAPALQVALAGQLADLQSRLNVRNLVEEGTIVQPAMAAFQRLFRLLGLPSQELEQLADKLVQASEVSKAAAVSLMPRHTRHLGDWGLSNATLARLQPFITLLPERTPVNLNTAAAEVVYAVFPGLADLGQAQRMVQERRATPYRTLDDVARMLPGEGHQVDEGLHAVNSSYFEIFSRVRYGGYSAEDLALVKRAGGEVQALARTRQWVPLQDRGEVMPPQERASWLR